MSLALCCAGPALGQPFGTSLNLAGDPKNGGVEVPHHPNLNPTTAFTLEAWVWLEAPPGAGEKCKSIAGKNYQQSWGLFACTVDGQRTLRSYLFGSGSARDSGVIPLGQWTHVAVTYDGANRRHYVNGELEGTFAEPGVLPTSASPMQIGSDVSWLYTPGGYIDEVRLWNVARSMAELRGSINIPIEAPQPGLVAVWSLDGTADDALGAHDGDLFGAGAELPIAVATVPNCFDFPTALCIQDERFLIHVSWRKPDGTTGSGKVVESSADSGLLYFFAENNWELMIKILNGCPLNGHYWMFSAATTNVFYRIDVLDVQTGTSKVYFNYPGPPAPAVTDTAAFATCS